MSRNITLLLSFLILCLLLLISQLLLPVFAAAQQSSTLNFLPGVSTTDNHIYTIEIENAAASGAVVLIDLTDQHGSTTSVADSIGAMSTKTITVNSSVPAGFTGFATIQSDQPLIVTGTLQTTQGDVFSVGALDTGFTQSFLAPFVKGPAALSSVFVHNNGATPTDVTLQFEGQACEQTVTLQPGRSYSTISSTNGCLPLHYAGNVEILSQSGGAAVRTGEVIAVLYRYDPTDMHKLIDYRISSTERTPLAISLSNQAAQAPVIESVLLIVVVLTVVSSVLWRRGISDTRPL